MGAVSVPVTYTNDILPKLRPGDIACMTPKGYQIGDKNWMCDATASYGFADHGNARVVYAALAGGKMPPDKPWPATDLQTYQNWMTGGFAA